MPVVMKDLYKLLDAADHHARALLRANTEIRSLLATISIPDKPAYPCRQCGVPHATERALAFHVQNVHGGPVVPMTAAEEAA